jgi:hypothetical protein
MSSHAEDLLAEVSRLPLEETMSNAADSEQPRKAGDAPLTDADKLINEARVWVEREKADMFANGACTSRYSLSLVRSLVATLAAYRNLHFCEALPNSLSAFRATEIGRLSSQAPLQVSDEMLAVAMNAYEEASGSRAEWMHAALKAAFAFAIEAALLATPRGETMANSPAPQERAALSERELEDWKRGVANLLEEGT